SISTENQRHLLGDDAAVAVDDGVVRLLELAVAGAALELPDGLGHVRHAARPARLAEAELAAVRVQGVVAPVGEVVLLDEAADLALLAEPDVLERERDRDRVAIVQREEVHVLRLL